MAITYYHGPPDLGRCARWRSPLGIRGRGQGRGRGLGTAFAFGSTRARSRDTTHNGTITLWDDRRRRETHSYTKAVRCGSVAVDKSNVDETEPRPVRDHAQARTRKTTLPSSRRFQISGTRPGTSGARKSRRFPLLLLLVSATS